MTRWRSWIECTPGGIEGVLTDGTSRWDLGADQFVDAGVLPAELSGAITAGAAAALAALEVAGQSAS